MLFILAVFENKEHRSRLEALYNEHASLMYKIAYRILKDQHLAQDAVQEAFINISKNFDKIIKIDCNKTRALFVIIVRNVSIDIYRQREKQTGVSYEEIEETLSGQGPSVEEILVSAETFAKLAKKMKELNPSYADILSLKYFYNYKDEEISQMLNITPENTRIRLSRARKNLIKLLLKEQEAANHE